MLHWLPDYDELNADVKSAIARSSYKTVYNKNSVIYLQEDSADKFYIVLSGYVRLSYIMEDGTAILYAIVPPGESFGELGVFDRSFYTDTASTIGTVSVLVVNADIFHTADSCGREIRAALSDLIASRYKTYIDVTKSLYLTSLSARLALSLLRLTMSLGHTMEYKGRVVPFLGTMVTQSDLGAMARGTRGNVNRVLKTWEREGLIVAQDRKIIILDPEGLETQTMNGGW
ncbi:CRP-like cAMP-binding protein [Breoghania corrubedonensis]|uniref:CRP-like cAMP-binding protein n=1 Tax=Breoghania corrubedonensis TaxID=665038 RepID=A0A2T5UYR7_9HYPH|nr:Crp/Fnr family transcriptional regulator [Breoghania corrubedonensis]PTW56658.1 CRP-like cAMP-binding protein [Breoghania corrubedonensis]